RTVNASARFRRIDGLEERASDLLVSSGTLLAAGRDGVYELRDDAFVRIAVSPQPVNAFAVAEGATPFVHYGAMHGLGRLRRTENGWRDEGVHDALSESYSIAVMPDDVFWIGRARRQVQQVKS